MSALPYWLYKGRTTTPINVPGRGPIVLTPRMKFFAPTAAVSHLMKIKLVVRLPDPEQPAENKPEEKVAVKEDVEENFPKPKSSEDQEKSSEQKNENDTETETKNDSYDSTSQDVVIASESIDFSQTAEEVGALSEEPLEKEKKTSYRGRRKKKDGVDSE